MKHVQSVRTPTGHLSLLRRTAEQLLAEGVISGTLDGDLHAADAATVKAAMMSAALCDFCAAPGPTHDFDVPDFEMPHGGTSTGGWAACDACAALVHAGNKKALLERSVGSSGLAFPKFSRQAVAELHERFWAGMEDRERAYQIRESVREFVEDTGERRAVVLTRRDVRVESAARITGLTREEIEAAVRGDAIGSDVVAKLTRLRKKYAAGATKFDTRTLLDLLSGIGPKPPLADVVPHWQRALDAKFGALSALTDAMKSGTREQFFTEPTDLKDMDAVRRITQAAQKRSALEELGFGDDLRFLRVAQAYSFNAETTAAIREAARGIPQDAPLSSVDAPNTGAGWFWFAEPLPITASPIASDQVNALLWGWTTHTHTTYEVTLEDEFLNRLVASDPSALDEMKKFAETANLDGQEMAALAAALRKIGVTRAALDQRTRVIKDEQAALVFSAYVIDARGRNVRPGGPAPSTRWHWPLHMTFREMVAFNGETWDKDYGPGSPNEGMPDLVGKDLTLRAVSELSLFFVMACLWFRQTVPVLTREPGHVERHARKRIQKEHKLDAPPTVHVVALRKSHRTPAGDAPAERREGAREYHCRWIVQGHPRLQPCGPGRKDKKLIWIEAHPAGPEGKPLRTREKVFAVVR